MPTIKLSIRKTLEENAAGYFETAKKAKSKLAGTQATIKRFEQEIPKTAKEGASHAFARKKEWYERFRWSFSPDGFLLVGGRDATSNEAIIKKHLEPTDLVFHTDAPGSPFVLLKQTPHAAPSRDSPQALAAAAQLCAAYSKAWKAGVATADVFWVLPDQLSKTPNTGEFLGKGSFIVRGEKNYLRPPVQIALGVLDNKPTCGVPALFVNKGAGHAVLGPGTEKPSDIAKKLAAKLGGTSDDWLGIIPAGGAVLTGWKKAAKQAANANSSQTDTDTIHKNGSPEETEESEDI